MRLPHLASRVFNTPLMIDERKAETIIEAVVLPKLRGEAFETVDASEPAQASRSGRIAMVPVRGTLVRRTAGLEAMSGLQSYDDVRRMLRAAVADPSVDGILLSVDSPGGEVAGVFDLADEIAEAGKPVYAVADDMACSAAYLIASAAEKVFCTQTATVGSIGVIAKHLDRSGANEKAGLVYTTVYAGDRKADFSPDAPLSKEARARLEGEIEGTYDRFVAAVASRRAKMDEKAVRATKATTYTGQAAVDEGLADQVGTLDVAASDLAARIASSRQRGPSGRARATADRPGAKPMPPIDPPREDAAEDQPAADGNVIDLEAVRREARAEGRAEAEGGVAAQVQKALAERDKAAMERATEITGMCATAGMPQLAGELIASGKDVLAVSKDLLARRADASDSARTNAQHGGQRADEAQKATNYGWDAAFAGPAAQRARTRPGAPGAAR